MSAIAGLWGKGNNQKMMDILSDEQPIYNEDKSIYAVLNGKIFNYIEIKKELKNHDFRTETDTEMIIHAYEEFGIDCVNKFNGNFAFAIWDRKSLFLVRDRLGQKFLYYYYKNGRLIFASEIKSILNQVETYPNLTENFMVFETTLDGETLFKDIFSLPAGSILTFDGTNIEIKRYWEIKSCCSVYLSEERYIERLRWLIEDSVRLRLKSKVPVGLLLSGGMDSSLIAYLAKPAYVFSCHYDLGDYFDELRYAQMVANDIGAEHHIVRPTSGDFQRFYEKIIWHLDQPIATASTISAFLLAKEAARSVKVVLNGEGADELFGGYIRYLLMLIEEGLSKICELKNYHSLARHFWNAKMFDKPAERYFELIRRGVPQTDLPLTRVKDVFSRHRHLIDQMCACDIEITLPSLLMMGERVCAAFGLENRSPFLDYRIVEFAFSLPPELKIKEYQTKYILRKVARGIVPDEILKRKDKKGLVTPIFQWFSTDLYEWSKGLVNSFRKRGIDIRPGVSRDEYDRYLYTLVSLELWFRIFIDAKKSSSLKTLAQLR